MTGIPAGSADPGAWGVPTAGSAAGRQPPAGVEPGQWDNNARGRRRRPSQAGSASTNATARRRRIGRHSDTATAKHSPSATAMTRTSSAPSGMPNKRSESTIEDDINQFLSLRSEPMSPRQKGRTATQKQPLLGASPVAQ